MSEGRHRPENRARAESERRTMADEQKAHIAQMAFDLNGLLTTFSGMDVAFQRLGGQVLEMRSENPSAVMAGGLLTNQLPEDLRAVKLHMSQVIDLLEDFADKL